MPSKQSPSGFDDAVMKHLDLPWVTLIKGHANTPGISFIEIPFASDSFLAFLAFLAFQGRRNMAMANFLQYARFL